MKITTFYQIPFKLLLFYFTINASITESVLIPLKPSFFGSKSPPRVSLSNPTETPFINCQELTTSFPDYTKALFPLLSEKECSMFAFNCKLFKKSMDILTEWAENMSDNLKKECEKENSDNIMDLFESEEVESSGYDFRLERYFQLLKFVQLMFEEVLLASQDVNGFSNVDSVAVLSDAYGKTMKNVNEDFVNSVVLRGFNLAPSFDGIIVDNVCSYSEGREGGSGKGSRDTTVNNCGGLNLETQRKTIKSEIPDHIDALDRIIKVWDMRERGPGKNQTDSRF